MRTENNSGQTIQRGYLWKRGSWNSSWKRRYFVLHRSGSLFYFKKDTDQKCLGTINLKEGFVGVNEIEDAKRAFAFEISTKSRNWKISGESERDMRQWMRAIEEHANTNTNSFSLKPDPAGRRYAMGSDSEGELAATDQARKPRELNSFLNALGFIEQRLSNPATPLSSPSLLGSPFASKDDMVDQNYVSDQESDSSALIPGLFLQSCVTKQNILPGEEIPDENALIEPDESAKEDDKYVNEKDDSVDKEPLDLTEKDPIMPSLVDTKSDKVVSFKESVDVSPGTHIICLNDSAYETSDTQILSLNDSAGLSGNSLNLSPVWNEDLTLSSPSMTTASPKRKESEETRELFRQFVGSCSDELLRFISTDAASVAAMEMVFRKQSARKTLESSKSRNFIFDPFQEADRKVDYYDLDVPLILESQFKRVHQPTIVAELFLPRERALKLYKLIKSYRRLWLSVGIFFLLFAIIMKTFSDSAFRALVLVCYIVMTSALTPILHVSILRELMKMWDTLYLTSCLLCYAISSTVLYSRDGEHPVYITFYYILFVMCVFNVIFLDAVPGSIFPLSAKQFCFTIVAFIFGYWMTRFIIFEETESDVTFRIGKTWELTDISAWSFGTLTIYICKICLSSFIFPRDYILLKKSLREVQNTQSKSKFQRMIPTLYSSGITPPPERPETAF